ncbi:MAG: ABC transporter transmembrane domain-containing protein [Roseiflexus sp.]
MLHNLNYTIKNLRSPVLLRRVWEWVQANRSVRVLAWLAPFLYPDRQYFLVVAVTTLLLTITETAMPVIIGMVVDVMLNATNNSPSDIPIGNWLLLVLLASLAPVRGFLIARRQAQIGNLGERVAARIRARLWAHLQYVPLDYVRRCGPGRLSLRFISDTRMPQRLIAQGIVQLAQDILLLGAILVTLMTINWRMALGVALVMPVYTALFYRLNPSLRHASRAARRSRSRLAAYLHDRLEGMAVIKTYVRQTVEERRLKRLARRLARNGPDSKEHSYVHACVSPCKPDVSGVAVSTPCCTADTGAEHR